MENIEINREELGVNLPMTLAEEIAHYRRAYPTCLAVELRAHADELQAEAHREVQADEIDLDGRTADLLDLAADMRRAAQLLP